jgi:hypothetical protein
MARGVRDGKIRNPLLTPTQGVPAPSNKSTERKMRDGEPDYPAGNFGEATEAVSSIVAKLRTSTAASMPYSMRYLRLKAKHELAEWPPSCCLDGTIDAAELTSRYKDNYAVKQLGAHLCY